MINITIPPVGESITEVVLLKWTKNDGDLVERDEIIAEVESEKASFEISAEESGILKTTAKAGDTLAIGDIIGTVDPKKTKGKKATKKATKDTPSIDIVIQSIGESISEVKLDKWTKKSGDFVQRDEVIAEIESEKASFEITAEQSGKLTIIAKEDETLSIGAVIGKIEIQEAPPSLQKATNQTPSKEQVATSKHPSITPLAKAIISEEKIDASKLQPTAPSLRITKNDVLAQALQFSKTQQTRTTKAEKMSSLRKTISRRLVEAKNTTAMLTTFNEVDMSAIMQLRTTYKEQFKEKHGVGLGFMSFFTRACCLALQEIPAVNAYINQDEILYHNYCDISIAVSSPKGLVVPVIRDAQNLQMHEIEQEVVRLAKKARDGKLSMDEMQGGTFTITNGGVFGSLLSTPIINLPQSAILGMHKIEDRPVAINKKIEIRPMMYVALSYDHRIIDGKESVTFLVKVKQYLENPALLLSGKHPVNLLLDI